MEASIDLYSQNLQRPLAAQPQKEIAKRAHVHVWVRYLRTHVEHAALWDEVAFEILLLFIQELSYLEKNSNIVIE